MPRKVRELIRDLEKAGFSFRPGKGSHKKFTHTYGEIVIISGKIGDDAKPYQEREVKLKIQKSKQKY
jgi:predicted RNA binding protein YcfA (HicA-like mRNA interferase family)